MRTGERGRLRVHHRVPDHRSGPRGHVRLAAVIGAVLVALFIAEGDFAGPDAPRVIRPGVPRT